MHGASVADAMRGSDHGGTTEGMADEQRWRAVIRAKPVGGRNEIVDVGTEIGTAEIAAAAAQPGEVEAQHAETRLGQCAGDVRGGLAVL